LEENFFLNDEDWSLIKEKSVPFFQLLNQDLDLAQKKYPFFSLFLLRKYLDIHDRKLSRDKSNPQHFACSCFPGHTRLFCNSSGQYFPCERVPESPVYQMGDVYSGFDVQKAIDLMETFRSLGDCGNCSIDAFCHMCFASIDLDTCKSGSGILADGFKLKCQEMRRYYLQILSHYTEIMEKNKNAFDIQSFPDDILPPKVYIIS
jgi:radical SAM protein with 4Fe4S-binding SPASM domain